MPVDKLREALEALEMKMAEDTGIKEKGKIVRAAISNMADTLQIDLKLRKRLSPYPLSSKGRGN